MFIDLRWQGTAVLFDLGRLDRFPAAEILKLTHIFVSHTHLDHFIGFDRVVRLFLNRDAALSLYGPPGFIRNVLGKLAGYTWNLVDGYPLVLTVHEVHPDHIDRVRLPATTAFSPEDAGRIPFTGLLHDAPAFSVRTAHLDHKIPCLAFALSEKTHLNVRTDELERLGIPPGPWLNRVKDALRTAAPDETIILANWDADGGRCQRQLRLGDLRDRLVVERPGQKLAYVVDTLFNKANAAAIVELARDADIFFCESLFVDADRDQGLKRHHLTARQAGTLARLANVKRLEVFHFSPRYDGMPERLYNEAAATFSGEIAPDEPV